MMVLFGGVVMICILAFSQLDITFSSSNSHASPHANANMLNSADNEEGGVNSQLKVMQIYRYIIKRVMLHICLRTLYSIPRAIYDLMFKFIILK